MAFKRMVSYSIHEDEPVIYGRVSKPVFWLIRLRATNGRETITVEIETKDKCYLTDLNEFIQEQFVEIIVELSPVTEATFNIYRIM